MMYLVQTSDDEICNLEFLVSARITETGTILEFSTGKVVVVTDELGAGIGRWLAGACLRFDVDDEVRT